MNASGSSTTARAVERHQPEARAVGRGEPQGRGGPPTRRDVAGEGEAAARAVERSAGRRRDVGAARERGDGEPGEDAGDGLER